MPTIILYTHYLQHAKHCQKWNYVQNHINIILLYGMLQITVLFDMCAAFALGAVHDFQIWYGADGGKGNGTGAAVPCSGAAHGGVHR